MSWDEAVATSIVNEHKHLAGATLPILHALQENFGYIDRAAIPLIAEALNVSKAEVLGTITFYHDFRSEPAGRRVIKLCRAEACQAVGCETLVDHAAREHHLAIDSTSATIQSVTGVVADNNIIPLIAGSVNGLIACQC